MGLGEKAILQGGLHSKWIKQWINALSVWKTDLKVRMD
jgi:hypothetical protein